MKDNERMAITKITAEIFFIVKQCILLTEVSQSIMKLIKIFFFQIRHLCSVCTFKTFYNYQMSMTSQIL